MGGRKKEEHTTVSKNCVNTCPSTEAELGRCFKSKLFIQRIETKRNALLHLLCPSTLMLLSSPSSPTRLANQFPRPEGETVNKTGTHWLTTRHPSGSNFNVIITVKNIVIRLTKRQSNWSPPSMLHLVSDVKLLVQWILSTKRCCYLTAEISW